MIKKTISFLKKDIWRIRLSKVPARHSFFIKNLRVVLLALRGFDENKCVLRASALTFYTLLSIVPIFAMAFGIAKGFGLENRLESLLTEKFVTQSDIITNIINFARSMLESAKGGVVAGVGVAFLFWAVIKVLGQIEHSFNDIWGIKKMRPLARRFSDYLSIMLICPVLLILASGVTVFINTQARLITEKIAFLGVFSPLIYFILGLLPYTVLWVVFAFIYIFIPNTKVNFKSALLAGVAAGTIYQIIQWVYVEFQVGVAKYNVIYGSFAALPLFLIWLQLSWRIMLFGAEISFAHQNVETYEFEPDCLNVSRSFKKLLSLRIASLIVKNFSKGEAGLTATQISHALDIPIRLVRDILYDLSEAGVVSTTSPAEERIIFYQPARDTGALNIKFVIDRLEEHGTENIPILDDDNLKKIKESLKAFSLLIEKSPANLKLKDI